MVTKLVLGDIAIDVVLKDIKNVHLSVHPPMGHVRISAPSRMKIDTVRLYAISKLDWIKSQQKQLRSQQREPRRDYLERESHYVWGKRYLLRISEHDAPPAVEFSNRAFVLRIRPETSFEKRQRIIEAWYREQAKAAAESLFRKWEPVIGVKVEGLFIQRMKTRWGSCNTQARTIRLNPELVKKTPECLEYIVVHEMIHLIERNHNERFRSYMEHFLPAWSAIREELNRAPLAHTDWSY